MFIIVFVAVVFCVVALPAIANKRTSSKKFLARTPVKYRYDELLSTIHSFTNDYGEINDLFYSHYFNKSFVLNNESERKEFLELLEKQEREYHDTKETIRDGYTVEKRIGYHKHQEKIFAEAKKLILNYVIRF